MDDVTSRAAAGPPGSKIVEVANPTTREVPVARVRPSARRIAYRRVRIEGPPVVYLHGSPGSGADGIYLAEQLARRYRVIWPPTFRGSAPRHAGCPDYGIEAHALYVLAMHGRARRRAGAPRLSLHGQRCRLQDRRLAPRSAWPRSWPTPASASRRGREAETTSSSTPQVRRGVRHARRRARDRAALRSVRPRARHGTASSATSGTPISDRCAACWSRSKPRC